jgi:glutaryl-CoA dehydrogenase
VIEGELKWLPKEKNFKQHKPLPRRTATSMNSPRTCPPRNLAIVKKVRDYMETKVSPLSTSTGSRTRFRLSCFPSFKELGIAGLGIQGYGCPGGSPLLVGLTAMNIARTDTSMATFWGVHTGLAMGSINLNGTEEQKQKWLPPMARMEKIGCFGLTEPLVGSGTCRRPDDDGEARRRHLDSQWPEALDRQRDVVRHLDHLGTRPRR